MSDGLLTASAVLFNALFFVGGIYIYLALVRQISAREDVILPEPEKIFGWPDAILASFLGLIFTLNAVLAAPRAQEITLGMRDLVANACISLGLFLLVAAFLNLRGRRFQDMSGLGHVPFWRSLTTALVLLFAAYPLIFLADRLTQHFLGGPSSKQSIVELFDSSPTLQQRVLIIILAVGIAPLVEEFVFRFYLYGVARRYLGRFVGVILSGALFAAVHAHIPSAAPLFVLGVCFALAYEWSGSIVVSMTMHALFNSMTLVALAFPDAFPQQ